MVKKSAVSAFNPRRSQLLRTVRLHFYFLLACAGALITFEAWNLITHQASLWRWTYLAGLAIVCCLVWFYLKCYARAVSALTRATYVLIVADIIFAGLNVYAQRGMASKAVMLFVLPLLVAAQLKDRATLLVTAGLSVVAYSLAAIRYFYTFYGEGYRVELYGEVGFYSLLLVIFALLLMPARASR